VIGNGAAVDNGESRSDLDGVRRQSVVVGAECGQLLGERESC
jgi:hypothetical protein